MHKRIKQLREHLKLSQEKFGAAIGLTQRSISTIENGVIDVTPRNFDAICRVFNVNPEWLRNGEGKMFSEPKDGLSKLKEEYNLNDFDMALIKSFLELPPEMRQMALEFGKIYSRNMARNLGIEENFSRKSDDLLSVEEKRRIVNEELDSEEKGQISLASTGTNGLSLKKSKQIS